MEKEPRNNEFNKNQTLPPRSTIHNLKAEKLPSERNWSSISMLLGSFAFILIIAAIIYFQFDLFKPKLDGTDIDGTSPLVGEENQQTEGDLGTVNNDQKETGIEDSNDSDVVENEGTPVDNAENDQDIIHIVIAGDNLFRISKQYYNANYSEALAKYNGLSDPNDIFAGMPLKIPKKERLID